MERLDVRVRELSDWTLLEVAGPLDVATAPAFRQALLEAQYGRGARVAVDLSGLEFLDSFGLGVLVGGAKRARLHAGELLLVAPPSRIRRVLEVSGVDRLLTVVADLDALPPSPGAGTARPDGN